ncbi:MAG TPA: four helix bundle protein, partial [Dehalococcoidia bacterium]|nr:four helix bundle protein [Dehalococcoidia bacterium]
MLKDDRWLRSQIMSAAFSVPSNIVEGYSRGSNREFAHFLAIARASLAEVEYQLHFMDRVGLARGEGLENLRELVKRAGQTTYGLLRSVRADTKDDESNRRYLRDDAAEYIAGTP